MKITLIIAIAILCQCESMSLFLNPWVFQTGHLSGQDPSEINIQARRFEGKRNILRQNLIVGNGKYLGKMFTKWGLYGGDYDRGTLFIGPLKNYFCEAKTGINDHLAYEAKPSKGKIDCPRAHRVQVRYFLGLIKCDHNIFQ